MHVIYDIAQFLLKSIFIFMYVYIYIGEHLEGYVSEKLSLGIDF